jgi:hypothetical protein
VECAEEQYVERIRSTLLCRPEASSSHHYAMTSPATTTSLIYPVVGVPHQMKSQSKLISDIVAHFNQEADRINLVYIRGGGGNEGMEIPPTQSSASAAPSFSMPLKDDHSTTTNAAVRESDGLNSPARNHPNWHNYYTEYQNLLLQSQQPPGSDDRGHNDGNIHTESNNPTVAAMNEDQPQQRRNSRHARWSTSSSMMSINSDASVGSMADDDDDNNDGLHTNDFL